MIEADFSGYDSDVIDEETESRLYSAIFHDHHRSYGTSDTLLSVKGDNENNFAEDRNGTFSDNFHDGRVKNTASLAPTTHPYVSQSSTIAESLVSNNYYSSSMENSLELTSMECTVDKNAGTTTSSLSSAFTGSSSASESGDCSMTDIILGVSDGPLNSLLGVPSPLPNMMMTNHLRASQSDINLWKISDEDEGSRKRKRYFNHSRYNMCSVCKRRGHFSHECTATGPACFLCGEEGHEKPNCPNIYCYVCFAPGHLASSCVLRSQLCQSVCSRCGQQGHVRHLCSELWRQYHVTTSSGRPSPAPKKMRVRPRGCCNCGRQGHAVEDCRRKFFRSSFVGQPPRRRVMVYDKKDIYRKTVAAVPHRRKLRSSNKQLTKTVALANGAMKIKHSDKLKRKHKRIVKDMVEKSNSSSVVLSLDHLHEDVAEKIFDMVVEREYGHRYRSDLETGNFQEVSGEPPSAVHDESDFLPIETTYNRRLSSVGKRHIHTNRASSVEEKDSPFSWINERTAIHRSNDDFDAAYAHSKNLTRKTHSRKKRRGSDSFADKPGELLQSKSCPNLFSYETERHSCTSSRMNTIPNKSCNILPSVFASTSKRKRKQTNASHKSRDKFSLSTIHGKSIQDSTPLNQRNPIPICKINRSRKPKEACDSGHSKSYADSPSPCDGTVPIGRKKFKKSSVRPPKRSRQHPNQENNWLDFIRNPSAVDTWEQPNVCSFNLNTPLRIHK